MVDGRRVDRTELHDGAVIEAGHTFFVFRACETEVSGDVLGAEEVQGAPRGLATMHPGLQDAFATLASVARSRLPVLIRGETGTGKELVANAVHGMSGRPGAIVPVNCASIPEDLLHAELFGARRGSYSGATADRPGLVQAAERGTLFLDEIAELPPRAQVILLRLLQECEITPLGSTRPVPIDVRFAAATHADVNAPGFRPDVLARLSGHVIGLPPLRDRREDIGLLIATILVEAGVDRDISMSLPVARALMAARWRLNIRQLRHSLLAATLMAGGRIASSHMTIEEAPPPRPPGVGAASAGPPPAGTSGRVDAARLRDLLQLHGGNISAVARALTTSRTQVTRLMRRFGLDPLGNSSGQ